MNCQTCGDPLSVHGTCGSCGYGRKSGKPNAEKYPDGDRWAIMAANAKHDFEMGSLTAKSLTEQQWYNVCKFWPNVAAHCKRQRPEIGPDNPLDATARQGPLLRRVRDIEGDRERVALEAA